MSKDSVNFENTSFLKIFQWGTLANFFIEIHQFFGYNLVPEAIIVNLYLDLVHEVRT